MTTVLEHRTWRGDLIGRCTARCHTAKGKRCYCICGGVNHGVGLRQAIDNLDEDRLTSETPDVYVIRLIQRPLFTQEKEEATQ